jgi:GMP synthase (glutamine-hydrolysing)
LLHVDNGLMRKEESRGVVKQYERMGLGERLHFVDASDEFLSALGDVVEPEAKRAIIGQTFIDVFEREAKRLGITDHLLGQGTIYPDTIETGGTQRADVIKTHHNRVPTIERLIAEGRVVEPLADLYKVEVRELGERLGLPRGALWRHPFPGPGLGVRLLCADGQADMETISRLAPEVRRFGERVGLDARVLPIRSVGVKADVRSFEYPVLFSGDASWDVLSDKAGELLKTTDGINRCLWNLSERVPLEVRLLAATMTRSRLDLLRAADDLVMEGLRRHGLYDDVWQCPTVLVPLEIDGKGSEMVIVRPVRSERAMTATPVELPLALLNELRSTLLSWASVSGLALDLTSKPPGTIEWE